MNKRLALSLLTALCALSFSLVSCKKQEQSIDDKKTFTVGFDAEFPPYGFKDEKSGDYIGFDLDLAAEVAKRNNWSLVKKPINWDAKDMEMNSGAIDCIWNGFTITGREKEYEWTEPYVDNSQVVLVRKDSSIKTLADLAGKTVAAQTDTPVLKALQPKGDKEALGKSFKKLVVSATYNNAVMELESGAVDAVALDIGVAKRKMKDSPDKFAMLPDAIMSEQYGIGFKLGNKALRDKVQATFKEMVKDGTAAKISEKWFEGKNVIILAP